MIHYPTRTLADIEAVEAVPLAQWLAGLTFTYDVFKHAVARPPETIALSFLPQGLAWALRRLLSPWLQHAASCQATAGPDPAHGVRFKRALAQSVHEVMTGFSLNNKIAFKD